MEKHEWGMKIVEGPFVTLDEAKRRITTEHGCIYSWRKSSERKARELEECGEHIETLEAELRTLRADKERLETERNRALEGGQIVARRLDAIARLKRYESIPGPAEAFRDPGPWVRWAELEPLLTPPSIDAAKEK